MPSLTPLDYHTPFLADLTAQDAAAEQAHRARLDAQADAEAAALADFLTAQEQEEEGEANEREPEIWEVGL